MPIPYYMNGTLYKAILIIAIAFSFDVAQAAEVETEANVKRTEVRMKAGAADVSCIALEDRIGKRLARLGTAFKRHEEGYADHAERLIQISAKLEAEGITSSRLRSGISALESKIQAFQDASDHLRSSLEDAKDFACGEGTNFRAAIGEAKRDQKEVEVIARAIGILIRTTIRQDIFDLLNSHA